MSGAAMVALGVALLAGNPRKDWNRVFGLLATFWGTQIVLLNGIRLTDDPDVALLLAEVGFAFLLPVYFFLAYFAAVFPRPRGPLARSGIAVGLLALPAVAALVALFAAPDLIVGRVTTTPSGALTMVWGPLAPWLVLLPLHGAVFYALFTMMRRLEDAESGIERKQITFVLAAFALYVAYNAPAQFLLFGLSVVGLGVASEANAGEALAFALVLLASVLLLALLAVRLRRRAREAPPPAAGEARAVLAAVAVAFGAAVAATASPYLGGPAFELLGLFRLGSVGLVVYAIARWQLFDLDLRVKHGAAVATALVPVAAVASAAWFVLEAADVPPAAGAAVATLAALGAFVPLLRWSQRIADRVAPAVSRDGEHLYLRKLEVYRAAVEAALAEGRAASPDDAALAELRAKLELGDRDHGVVVSLAVSRAEPRHAAPDLRPGGVVFGKYVVDSLLAEGGFGRVFLARDRILGRQVVIKELLAKWRSSPAVVAALLQEARIAGQLSHPNLVAVHEVERHGQDHYVVMEHCPGGSLQDRLGADGRMPLGEALEVAAGVLEGLAAAHGRGIVHRDVKPANVLFGTRGDAKLADFGIARFDDEDPQRTISGLTTGALPPGTLQWMSPEQARGRPLDARSDVYAVGALLYRMLAGRPHVDVRGLDELAARQAVADAAPPPTIPGVPPEVDAVVRRALARDPAARFASAHEMRAALAPLPRT